VESVVKVRSGTEQISDASQSLSQGATEQASSLEEITASMAEIASQTKTNAENATQANALSNQARDAAENGSRKMDAMVAAMNDINDSSQQIAKIIKVIDDIAFQTNLLALNAAVEAARAGRHGKGFAVVADEVRNLAGRSAKAASETAELIESSNTKVGNGLQMAEETSESFASILDGVVKATDLVGEIAAASNEQAEGVSQVNQGLSQVDQVTQQNTASAEETASAAEELRGQAVDLQKQIARFKLSSEHTFLTGNNMQKNNPALSSSVKKEKAGEGWAQVGAVEDKQVINLDDKEFGKY
jgi:methyl-accepting chemotaxis protein